MSLRAFLAIIGFLTAPWALGQEFIPGSVESREYLDTLTQIERAYPPQDSYIVGLGRSPWVWVEGMRLLHDGWASHLPLSQFRYMPGTPTALNDEYERALFRYFDQVIPPASVIRGRRLVILDYTVGQGASARAAQAYLRRYLEARGRQEEVHVAVFADSGSVPGVDRVFQLLRTDRGVRKRLAGQSYDPYSPHDRTLVDSLVGGTAPVPDEAGTPRSRLIRDRIRSLLVSEGRRTLLSAQQAQEQRRQDLATIRRGWRDFPRLSYRARAQVLLDSEDLLPHREHLAFILSSVETASDEGLAQLLDSARRISARKNLPILKAIVSRVGNRGSSEEGEFALHRLLAGMAWSSPEGRMFVHSLYQRRETMGSLIRAAFELGPISAGDIPQLPISLMSRGDSNPSVSSTCTAPGFLMRTVARVRTLIPRMGSTNAP